MNIMNHRQQISSVKTVSTYSVFNVLEMFLGLVSKFACQVAIVALLSCNPKRHAE